MGKIIDALRDAWRAIVTPPVMAADVADSAISLMKNQTAFALGVEAHVRRADRTTGQTSSYRHVRPFPPFPPMMQSMLHGTAINAPLNAAWHEENVRREYVRVRWGIRQATRAARPPKGHDHPEWV